MTQCASCNSLIAGPVRKAAITADSSPVELCRRCYEDHQVGLEPKCSLCGARMPPGTPAAGPEDLLCVKCLAEDARVDIEPPPAPKESLMTKALRVFDAQEAEAAKHPDPLDPPAAITNIGTNTATGENAGIELREPEIKDQDLVLANAVRLSGGSENAVIAHSTFHNAPCCNFCSSATPFVQGFSLCEHMPSTMRIDSHGLCDLYATKET